MYVRSDQFTSQNSLMALICLRIKSKVYYMPSFPFISIAISIITLAFSYLIIHIVLLYFLEQSHHRAIYTCCSISLSHSSTSLFTSLWSFIKCYFYSGSFPWLPCVKLLSQFPNIHCPLSSLFYVTLITYCSTYFIYLSPSITI